MVQSRAWIFGIDSIARKKDVTSPNGPVPGVIDRYSLDDTEEDVLGTVKIKP